MIFSDNGASQYPAQNEQGLDVSGEKWFANGSWHDSEPEGITVHFQNYDNWNKVNIYYYNGEREGTSWTGVPMSADGDGWYTYKIFEYNEARVLFNNGNGTQIPPAMEPGFVVSNEMWYRNGTWTTERPEEITVYFYKPSDWSTPNIYYYKNDSDTGPAWSGNAMQQVQDNWYTYTITKYSEAKVMFNSGSNQIPAQNQPGLDATGVMWYKDDIWVDSYSDSDNDKILDYIELYLQTNPYNKDTDLDSFSDYYEMTVLGTNPNMYNIDEDYDNDGLSNHQEMQLGTNPYLYDSDFDGISDSEDSNPLKTNNESKISPNFNINIPIGNYDIKEEYIDENGNSCERIYNKITGNVKMFVCGDKKTIYFYNNGEDISAILNYNSKDCSFVTYEYKSGNISNISCNGFNYGFDYDNIGNMTRLSIGDDTIKQTYYSNGEIYKEIYGNGSVFSYEFNEDDHVIGKTIDGVQRFKWNYDENGYLTDCYDTENNSHCFYKYNENGNVVEIYNDDITIKYNKNDSEYQVLYHIGNEIKTQTTKFTYFPVKNNKFTPSESTTKLISGDSYYFSVPSENESYHIISSLDKEIINEKYTSVDKKVSKIEYIDGRQVEYLYDKYDNIISILENGDETVSYEYDFFGQLIRENNKITNLSTIYNYDNNGNILSYLNYKYSKNDTLINAISEVTYVYDNEWRDKLTSYNNQKITYDNIGNPINYRDGMNFTWKNVRELEALKSSKHCVSYTYNSDGYRNSKTIDGNRVDYLLEGSKVISAVSKDAVSNYIYDSCDEVIGFEYMNSTYYFEKNAQKDIVSIYDKNGIQVCRYAYDAWGNFTITGNEEIANANPFRYRSYWYDNESGLYYLQTRYYDPIIKRFINADDFSYLGNNDNVLSFNLFCYCENNPITYLDTNGNVREKSSNSSDWNKIPDSFKVYVIYYGYNKGSGDFRMQANNCYNYNSKSKNTKLVSIETKKGFINSWNSIPSGTNYVFILMHGGKGFLAFRDGEIYNFNVLKSKYITTCVWLFSCEGGVGGKNSTAAKIADRVNGTSVNALNSGLSYSWSSRGYYARPKRRTTGYWKSFLYTYYRGVKSYHESFA